MSHSRKITLAHRVRRILRSRDSSYHPKNELYRWWVLGNVMIGTFMAVLDATVVNVGLPKIMASFGVSIDKIEWVLTAYMLAMAVMLPASGWFADRFGHKRMYFIGLFLFTFGSMMCGMSGNEDMLIFSRVIQGLGAGSLKRMPIGMAIITRSFHRNNGEWLLDSGQYPPRLRFRLDHLLVVTWSTISAGNSSLM